MARDGYEKIASDEDVKKFNLVSFLFFQWMNSVLKIGNERALEKSDFLPLSKEDTTRSVSDQLLTNWKKERARCKGNEKRPKLWKSVVKMLSAKELMILIFAGALFSLSRVIQPLFLGYLVSALMSAESQSSYLSYGCALAMCISTLIGKLSMHQLCYRCDMWAIRISCALKALVYFKTLKLGKQKILTFTIGRVIDLLSNDVQRLEGPAIRFLFLSIFPCLELVVIPVLLVFFVGWQALLGLVFVCLLVPFFTELSYISAALRRRTAAVSDQRISMMNQVVSGIRAIKTHAWEDIFREKIKHTRRHEINVIRKKSVILSIMAALEPTSVPLATLVSVITLVLTGQPLTPVTLFMFISYLGVLRSGICVYLANGLLENYEVYISLSRIEDFLLLENLSAISCERNTEDTADNLETISKKLITKEKDQLTKMEEVSFPHGADKRTVLSVLNLTYKPEITGENKFILDKISFALPSQSLSVITGPVGSGKSTLLSAIAGEVSDISGTVTSQGHVIYVPQEAWVFTGTIRENILFGHPYDEEKYNRIIEACALTEDIKQFPDGDETVVGERGEVLSGGQQARVSLARAVYADADLYLLDDPLSAVDFKVGQHIFDKCFKELLGDKTRVLTSHQEQHMKEADEVIVLYKGRVLEKGSYTELHEKGVLNTTIDSLYKEALKRKQTPKMSVYEEEEEEKSEDSDSGEKMVPLPSDAKGLEISEEDRKVGVVSSKLYWSYFRSGIPSLIIIGGICFCLITQALIVYPDVWLSFWSKQHPEDQNERKNLTIYGCLVAACTIFAIIRAYTFLLVSLRCSERLHDKMVVAIFQAPVLFFDSNPLGRILNRFAKDVGCMDELLPKNFLSAIQYGLMVLASIILPTVANPWLLVIDVPLIVLVLYFIKYYLKSSRELKRLESICRSPVFSHVSETLHGLDTIRTTGRQRDFIDQFYRYQDVHNRSFIMVIASARWLAVRMDLLASLLIGAVAVAAVLVSQDAAFAGLALVYVIQTAGRTQLTVRRLSDVENYMTSVERVITYTKLDAEPGYKVKRLPPEHWPYEGNIILQDVSMTYYPGGPQVLKKINLKIKGGAKIGVAGRTGAGKSSFVAALMRMPDADGDITVDDIRIKEINLQESRRCISVLGQSPVLFSGSLRNNLDILEQFQDADLWRALEDVQLKELVESLEGKLNHELLEHGANVSVGERQLICLARVLLQQSRIIILDEPTAHVDPDTEQTIWNVVREKLQDSTIITIAHRLNTIKDCDVIFVFKNGEVSVVDKFDSLVNGEGSALS